MTNKHAPRRSLPVSTSSSAAVIRRATRRRSRGAPPPPKPQGLRGSGVFRRVMVFSLGVTIRVQVFQVCGQGGQGVAQGVAQGQGAARSGRVRGSPRGGHKTHRDPRGESRDRSAKKGDKLTLELDGGSRPQRPPVPLPANAEKDSRPPAPGPRPETAGHAASDPLPPGTPGTGIPKPTAHVKGQTKVVPPERSAPPTPTASPNVNTSHQAKDYNKMVRPAGTPSTPKIGGSSAPRTAGTPSGGEANAAQECRDPKGSLPRQKQLGRREDSATGISVAMVSPCPTHARRTWSRPPNRAPTSASPPEQQRPQQQHFLRQLLRYLQAHEFRGRQRLRPEDSHEKGKWRRRRGRRGRRSHSEYQAHAAAGEGLQYGYMRGLGLHQTRTVPPSLHVSRLAALQDNANTVPQKGMRIGPHLKRPPGPNQVIDTDYSDLGVWTSLMVNSSLFLFLQQVSVSCHGNGGHSKGPRDEVTRPPRIIASHVHPRELVFIPVGRESSRYMSDGDVLRNVGYKSGNSSDLDGYLSEGGASLYAHRLNQRFKEGMRQVHESMNKVQHFIHDDSFDDSSSLSSGVSDTLNEMSAEDVLSSSLSSTTRLTS
ncbi:putative neuron navigator 3-like isoform X7, partial [Penaeus vannamei]